MGEVKENHNTTFIIVMSMGLLMALYGMITDGEDTVQLGTDWLSIGLSVAQIGGLFMLIANGTFILTPYYSYLKASIAVYLISLVFKMMHWPYSAWLISISVGSIIVLYFLSFLAKPIKKSLDYAKLLWVVTYFGYVLLKFFHLVKSDYQAASTICLWTAIGLYFLKEAQPTKQPKS